jgi:isochorismate synthase
VIPARIDLGTRLRATTREVDAPEELLDHLGRGGFAWFGEDVSFVTGGGVADVTAAEAAGVLAAIDHAAPAGAPACAGPVATGALGFDGTGRLVIPARVCTVDAGGRAWSTTIDHGIATRDDAPPPPSGYTVDATSSRDAWARGVERVLRAIEAGDVEKVVLARAVRVEADAPFAVERVLAQLRRTQPGCFVFAADGFVGATPELLVRREGERASTVALAGSTRRSADPAVDAHLGEQLLRSDKDREEQEIVSRRIVRALRPHSVWVTAAEEPVVVKMANIQHLATPIRAQLAHPVSAVELAGLLHPTPAVGGEPISAAAPLIPALEGLDRGWYAGPVGWTDRAEDGEFCVALRCALLTGAVARCYAGVGVVRDSDPAAELAETEVKLQALLPVLAG